MRSPLADPLAGAGTLISFPSPLGPFRRIGRILEQAPAVATGDGHHSVLHVPGSERLHIVDHRRPLGEKEGKAVAWAPLTPS